MDEFGFLTIPEAAHILWYSPKGLAAAIKDYSKYFELAYDMEEIRKRGNVPEYEDFENPHYWRLPEREVKRLIQNKPKLQSCRECGKVFPFPELIKVGNIDEQHVCENCFEDLHTCERCDEPIFNNQECSYDGTYHAWCQKKEEDRQKEEEEAENL